MDFENSKGRWIGAVTVGGTLLLVGLLGWRLHRVGRESLVPIETEIQAQASGELKGWRAVKGTRTAEEIVSSKVIDFARNRRKVALALAQRSGVEMRPEVERFFDAVERGDWRDINAAPDKFPVVERSTR